MKRAEWTEDSPTPTHAGCGVCFIHSSRMLPHQSTIHAQEVSFVYNFVQKPPTEPEAKTVVPWLYHFYKFYMR
jgi:hypothetical protein